VNWGYKVVREVYKQYISPSKAGCRDGGKRERKQSRKSSKLKNVQGGVILRECRVNSSTINCIVTKVIIKTYQLRP